MPPTRLLERERDGNLVFHEFANTDTPAYAILSHTWLSDSREEISFQDIEAGTGTSKAGSRKIRFVENKAWADGLRYLWVDTCCIDKRNNTELSRAINSMFSWYRNATRCYVYLEDVSIHDNGGNWETAFRKSRWFTRGWTLQELLAPMMLEFFSREGERLGSKLDLETIIHDVTAIPLAALRGEALDDFSYDERMNWASRRHTKEEEDHAYALLGIFDISMPLIYGEGKQKAYKRLRAEIEKDSRENIKKSGMSASTSASTLSQQLSREQEDDTTKSPDWLKPVVHMPSKNFESNVRMIDPSLHRLIAAVIDSNLRATCFEFYESNRLWRTKYHRTDGEHEQKLFEFLGSGGFPSMPSHLNLQMWLVKIRQASRWNEHDAIAAGNIYDFEGLGDLFQRMTSVCSLLDHETKLVYEDFEQNLLTSLEVCRQLNGWDEFRRLQVLWKEFHKSSTEIDFEGLEEKLNRLEVRF